MGKIYIDKRYREHRERKRANRASSLGLDIAKKLASARAAKRGMQFPCTQYQGRIADFAHDVLGVRTWHKQNELFDKVQRAERRENGCNRVACRSSHKASKTFSFAVVALYRYCCFPDSLTVLGAPSDRSIQRLVWREIRMLFRKSGICYACKEAGVKQAPCPHSGKIPGDCKDQARTGLRGLGFAEVFGVVAKDGENFAGYSSPTLCYLLDESTGIKDQHYDVMFSNMASSRNGFIFAVSNPTKRQGWFYNAFHKQKDSWLLVHISAYDCIGVDIPGLATQEFIDNALRDWGKESANFRIRVLGEFDDETSGGLFTLELLENAITRWNQNAANDTGILVIGCDPAGASGENDATGFAVRRGLSYIHLSVEYGLEVPQIVNHLYRLLADFRQKPDERVAICIDSSGIGYDLLQHLRAKHDQNIVITGVRGSDKAIKNPQIYDRVRDELVENFRVFLRDGGSLPPGECEQLIEEAQTFNFSENNKNLLKATRKEVIKKAIGRSPDVFDAACLAAWISVMPAFRPRRPAQQAAGVPQMRQSFSNKPNTDSLRARMQGGIRRG